MSFETKYTGEYGYQLVFAADIDLSAATSVVMKAQVGEVIKSLTCVVSPSTTATATVTQDFFDIDGVWNLQIQATFAASKRYQNGFTKIEIKEGIGD